MLSLQRFAQKIWQHHPESLGMEPEASMVHRLNLPVGESEKENWQTTLPLLVQVLSFQSW